jgi:hypothetical protein
MFATIVQSLRVLRRTLPAVVALAILGPPIQAATIRARQQTDTPAPADFRAWVAYLAGGPQEWATVQRPRLTTGIRELMFQQLQQDPSTSNVWVDYLLWKQSLNPTRFDHWHPSFVPGLSQVVNPQAKQALPTPPPREPQVAGTPSPPVSIPPPVTTPPTIVTPPSFLPPPLSSSSSTPVIPAPPAGNSFPEPNTWAISVMLIGAGVWWQKRSGPAAKTRS